MRLRWHYDGVLGMADCRLFLSCGVNLVSVGRPIALDWIKDVAADLSDLPEVSCRFRVDRTGKDGAPLRRRFRALVLPRVVRGRRSDFYWCRQRIAGV